MDAIIARRRIGGLGILFFVLLLGAAPADAGTLAQVFSSGQLAGLQLGPLGPALANTVATTYPVASASSSVTYEYNPAVEAFERRAGVLGPIVGERVETIGAKQINFSVSYSTVDVSTINGQSLGSLVNKPSINGQVVSFPVPDGVTLGDGRFANFLPVEVQANIDVQAYIFTPGVTYGITPDLDVNLTVPLLQTSCGVKVKETVPDPRLPQFALAPSDKNQQILYPNAFARAEGIGDVLLRGKYVLSRGAPVDLAAGLGLSFPSGDQDNFQGTGTFRVQPTLIASRVFADRFEPLVNLGVDINTYDADRSVFTWAVGSTAQIKGPLAAALVFLGRNEFSRQAAPIEPPFFFQIERNDIYDVSLGVRFLFAETGVVSANVVLPLNSDGLRADYIPTIGVEYAFSAPW